jgi:hypothetical protein
MVMSPLLYDTGTSATATGGLSYGKIYIYQTGTSTTSVTCTSTASPTDVRWLAVTDDSRPPPLQKKLNKGQTVELPDGSILEIDLNGNYRILDEQAQVTYKANRVREFNRYINASDLLEDFIRDLGVAGIKQGEVLGVPIEAFINWIIHRAAEADGDPVPAEIPRLEDQARKRHHPRCRCCGRFIRRKQADSGLLFCNGEHYQRRLTAVC